MNILFIDETLQLDQEYVGIGGVVFRDNSLRSLFTLFRSKKAAGGIPSEEEIKWSPDKKSWIAKNLIAAKRISTYSDILGLVKSFNGKIIVAVMRRESGEPDSTTAKWKCLEFVTERFQFFLQNDEDNQGLVIADFPGSGKEEKRLLRDYYQLLANGTKYVKPTNIAMNLLTTESRLNHALQLADLVVGITTAMCTPQRGYSIAYWDVIRHSFHTNRNGDVMGSGLKVFPPEIIEEIHPILFPEEVEDADSSDKSYEEYIEDQRYLYSAIMTEDELDMHFPRP